VEDDVEGRFVGVHALAVAVAVAVLIVNCSLGLVQKSSPKGSTQTPSIFSLRLCNRIFGTAAA
jgi:flagellar biosynthesis protein FliR